MTQPSVPPFNSPPQPLPETLWGENWQFGSVLAGDLMDYWGDRPIPYRYLPDHLLPFNLGLASSQLIPCLVIYGGRQSLRLATWLAGVKPTNLRFIANQPGLSGGIVLDTTSGDRWILVTFEDADTAQAAQTFEQRKNEAQGLHFLLVQPDDSGMTESGLWLLQAH